MADLTKTLELFDSPGNELETIAAFVSGDGVASVVARSTKELVRQHLFAYGRTHPNKLGGKRTQFYGDAARTIETDVEGSTAVVIITKTGIAQRLFGGEIKAKNVKYLTIPAIAAAHGKSAGDFANLRFVRFGKEESAPAALIEDAPRSARWSYSGKRVSGKQFSEFGGQYKSRVFFWLKQSVMQSGDPNVLPTDDKILATAYEAIEEYFSRRNLGGG
jgi:hypothetical protein